MTARRKMGRGRRDYAFGDTTYINNHHEHDHRGMRLHNPQTGETIYVKRDLLRRVRGEHN